MQAAGLDGIEFEAYGHLMDGFWSPATNHREHEYGGSLDNRLRFTWAVIDAVRKSVGPDFIVGIHMVADEDWEQGLSKEEGVEMARQIAATGKFDFLNIIRDHIDMNEVIPIRACDRRRISILPVKFARKQSFSRFTRRASPMWQPHAMLCRGQARHGWHDPHITDPHIVRKIMAGEEHRIRPCVGATYCLEGGEALCIHNAATGREGSMPHVARKRKPAAMSLSSGLARQGLKQRASPRKRGTKFLCWRLPIRPADR